MNKVSIHADNAKSFYINIQNRNNNNNNDNNNNNNNNKQQQQQILCKDGEM